MEKEVILIFGFLLTGLTFIGPGGFFGSRALAAKKVFSLMVIGAALALLVYGVFVEPLSLSFILFLIAAGLILEGLKTAAPVLFFKVALFSTLLVPFFFFLKLLSLAEAAAVAAFVFLIGGFASRFFQSFYDD